MKALVPLQIALLIIGLACKDESDTGESKNLSSTALFAGEGFDSLTLKNKGSVCVSSIDREQAVTENDGFFDRVDNLSQVKSRVGYTFSGEFTYGLAKGYAKASALSSSQSTERSLSYIMYTKYITKVKRTLNAATLEGYDRERCGDQFVSSIGFGAEMLVSVQFSFASSKLKETFQLSAGGSFSDIGKIKTTVKTFDERLKEHTTIKITRSSLGDDLNHLKDIFDGADFVTCSLKEFNKCERLITDIVNYSKDQLAKAAIASTTAIDFETSPYVGVQSSNNAEVIQKRDTLAEKLEGLEFDRNRANSLINSGMLDQPTKDHLSAQRNAIEANIEKIRAAIVICFDDIASCTSEPALRSYEQSALAYVTLTKEEVVRAKDKGVTDCGARARKKLDNTCEALGRNSVGELIKAEIIKSGPFKTKKSDSVINGRSCRFEYTNATCQYSIRL